MLAPSPLTIITDSTGTARSLWGLSLPDRRWFSSLVHEATMLLGEADLDTSSRADPVLAQLVDACLEMCGLRADWFSPTCLYRLLFEAGEDLPGAIAQLNGLSTTEDSSHGQSLHHANYLLRAEHKTGLGIKRSVLSVGTIHTLDQRVQRVPGLSLRDRSHYLNLLNALAADITLYGSSAWVQGLVDEALLLNGISPYWVDEAMAIALLYPKAATPTDPETPSLLMQWNFPVAEEMEDEPEEAETDPEAANYASLWSFTESLPAALELATIEPWAMLQRLMSKRNQQLEAQLDDQGEPIPFKKRAKTGSTKQGDNTPSPWFLELLETGTLNKILEDAE